MSEAPAAASAEGRPRRNTAQVTDKLAAAVAEAEELEAQGRYREAAELTALAMAEAHSQYVQSHKEVQPPLMPKPSQDYVERYKARLRVDWSKWDRLSTARAPQKPPTTCGATGLNPPLARRAPAVSKEPSGPAPTPRTGQRTTTTTTVRSRRGRARRQQRARLRQRAWRQRARPICRCGRRSGSRTLSLRRAQTRRPVATASRTQRWSRWRSSTAAPTAGASPRRSRARPFRGRPRRSSTRTRSTRWPRCARARRS